MITPCASAIACLSASTGSGTPVRSELNSGTSPIRSNVVSDTPAGSTSPTARSSARLIDALRRLPTIPSRRRSVTTRSLSRIAGVGIRVEVRVAVDLELPVRAQVRVVVADLDHDLGRVGEPEVVAPPDVEVVVVAAEPAGGRRRDDPARAVGAAQVEVVVGAGRAVQLDRRAEVDRAVVVLGQRERVELLVVPAVGELARAGVAAERAEVEQRARARRVVIEVPVLVDAALAVLVLAEPVAQLDRRARGVGAADRAARADRGRLEAQVGVARAVAQDADRRILGAVGARRIAILIAAAAQ